MDLWKKPLTLIAASVGLVSAELLMHWVFDLSANIAIFAGWMGGLSLADAFTRTFAKDHEIGKRLRLRAGAMLWLLPLGFAFLKPGLMSVSLALVSVLSGSNLIWWDEWQEKKEKAFAKLIRDPKAIPPQEREGMIRARVAAIQEKIEPDQDELARLNEELHTLEQKKLYRG